MHTENEIERCSQAVNTGYGVGGRERREREMNYDFHKMEILFVLKIQVKINILS